MRGQIIMSKKECKRVAVLQKLVNGLIDELTAAKELKISTRQIRRLKKRYKEKSIEGLIHKARGREGNKKTTKEKRRASPHITQQN